METRKFKQVPSISRIGARNPLIPAPVVVSVEPKKREMKAADFAGSWSDEDYMEPEDIIKIIKSERQIK